MTGLGHYRAIVTARAIADTIADDTDSTLTVGSIVELPESVTVNDAVDNAMAILDAARTAIPVLDQEGTTIVGWLSHQAVLAELRSTPATAASD